MSRSGNLFGESPLEFDVDHNCDGKFECHLDDSVGWKRLPGIHVQLHWINEQRTRPNGTWNICRIERFQRRDEYVCIQHGQGIKSAKFTRNSKREHRFNDERNAEKTVRLNSNQSGGYVGRKRSSSSRGGHVVNKLGKRNA